MLDACQSGPFSLQTATTESMAAAEIHKSYHCLDSTVAHYKNFFVGILAYDVFDNKPPVSVTNLCSWFVRVIMTRRVSQSFVGSIYGDSKREFYRPSIFDPPRNGVVGNFCDFAPLCKSVFFSLMNDNPIHNSVSHLLHMCSPAAIFRRVIFVVVGSIKRKIKTRSKPHIFQEVLKLVPAFTHRYSTIGIALAKSLFFRVASGHHMIPTSISRCVGHSMFCHIWYSTHVLRICQEGI